MTLPRYEDTTEYLSQWSCEIEKEAEKKSIKIKVLRDKMAIRKEFEKVISKLDYNMIIFNGHGSENHISGENGETIIKEGDNESLLVDRITYARSCDSAKSLGYACMVDNKIGCFIGYNLLFMFYIDQKWVASPKKDKTAGLFLSASNLIPISLIKGNTAEEAHTRSKNQILKNIKKTLRQQTKDSYIIAGALWNNYEGLTLIGNKKARL